MGKKGKRVFLDYASITPVDSKVEEEMRKVQKKFWANPSSLHTEGEEAKTLLEEARINIARVLRCRGSELFFTSGGTEYLNIAILGVLKSQGQFFQGSPFNPAPYYSGSDRASSSFRTNKIFIKE